VASIDEIKAGVARFAAESSQQLATLGGVAQQLDQAGAGLRAVTSGTGHAQISEALARLQQAKQKLAEAQQLVSGAVEATRGYAAGL
jgi:hypothetical protein